MIEELRISQLGVIERSVVELGPGLTVITGETGAGKTMLVTALGLLMGNRADASAVRDGAGMARVEGVVNVAGLSDAQSLIDEAGGEVEDGHVLVARTLSAEGRSRAFLGGAGVPAGALSDLAGMLVAVHGQSDQHRLLSAQAQLEALDRFAGPEVAALRQEFATEYSRWRALRQELAQTESDVRERAREADLLRFGLAEIDAAEPTVGEAESLAAEESRLAHADALRIAADTARTALTADDGPDALSALSAARHALEPVRPHDPALAALSDRLAEATYVISDIAADIAGYLHDIDVDPQRLASVSERRAVLAGLTRKYGATVDEVLAYAETSRARLLELDGTDERITFLREEVEAVRHSLGAVGERLSAARRAAADRLATQVTDELTALAMPHAELVIDLTQTPVAGGVVTGAGEMKPSASGLDLVEFGLAANIGARPRPLAKGASGGELSRVMLALEVVLAGTSPVPTFVFDEVDAGVGGKAAIEVGRRLAQLARTAQVLCVTHLPQVAACADRHLVVTKSSDGVVTSSNLRTLSDTEREVELSRMFAGLESSDTALAHARELLATALDQSQSDSRA